MMSLFGTQHPDDQVARQAEFKGGTALRTALVNTQYLIRRHRDQGRVDFATERNEERSIDVTADMAALERTQQQLQESERRLCERNKSLEQRLAERTAELEQQTWRLRQLTNELIGAEQQERKRIAQLLHDGLQQILAGAEIQLSVFAREGEPEALECVQQLLREATQTSRSLAHELAPPALYEPNFADALGWLACWFGKHYRFFVAIDVATDMPILPEHSQVFLFQALRELLLNRAKRCGVREAAVRCAKVGDHWLQIVVWDAGQEINPAYPDDAATIEKGCGLRSLRERLSALGGSLEIATEPGANAHFVINFPVGAPEADAQQRCAEARWAGADGPATVPLREHG